MPRLFCAVPFGRNGGFLVESMRVIHGLHAIVKKPHRKTLVTRRCSTIEYILIGEQPKWRASAFQGCSLSSGALRCGSCGGCLPHRKMFSVLHGCK